MCCCKHIQQPRQQQFAHVPASQRHQRPMASLIALGIGLGAEKLGRKISEKRHERKERKAAEEREAIYGHAESSSAGMQHEKEQQARHEKEMDEGRLSVSSERTLLPEEAPPRYEEVVGHHVRRE